MADEMEKFTYAAESLGEDQLRIVELLPGHRQDTIGCNIRVIDRGTNVAYKALSYAWGNTTPTRCIQVDQRSFWLHENLHEALQGIRDPEETLTLWTDKICINQDNLQERNAQVQRMGETYSQADEVLIWLGGASGDSKHLDVLKYALENHSRLSQVEWMRTLPSVLHIIDLAWVDRLWVLQEAVLARKGRIFLGRECIDLTLFFRFHEIDWNQVALMLGSLVASLDDSTPDLGDPRNVQSHLNKAFGGDVEKYILRLSLLYGVSFLRDNFQALIDSDATGNLAGLLSLSRQRHCHDPRDHVFGIIGLSQRIAADWQGVDYSMTTEDVFIRATTKILEGDSNALLEVIDDHVGPEVPDKVSTSLPSWVPDLSRPTQLTPFHTGLYCAGGDQQAALAFNASSYMSRTLLVSGYLLDSVLESSATEGLSYRYTAGLTSDIAELEQRFIAGSQTSSPYGNYSGRLRAFWRTLVADSFLSGNSLFVRYSPDDSGIDYEIFMERAELRQDFIGPRTIDQVRAGRRFSVTITTLSYRRPIFRTTSGLFGLGARRGIVQGDLILVVPGLRMPLIVRGLSEDPEDLRVHLLGPCYVHGIMDGEAIAMFQKPEIAEKVKEQGLKAEPQVFEIV